MPEDFFSMNVHLLSLLHSQILSAGPLQNCSMFAFEAGMKQFKRFCYGTVAYDKQMAECSLLYKHLYFEVRQSLNVYSKFSDLLTDLGIGDFEKNSFIDDERCCINGIMFHSLNYNRKSSSSHLCFLSFCEIIQFVNDRGNKTAVVQKYRALSFVTQHFNELLYRENREIFELLSKVDNLLSVKYFNIVDCDSFSCESVYITQIKCKALRVNFSFSGEDVTFVTPIVQVGENK